MIRKLLCCLKPKITGETSDGYHTFNELYDHRCLLFINLCIERNRVEDLYYFDHYKGWFCLVLTTQRIGQVSYHIPDKFREIVVDAGIRKVPTHEGQDLFDGHTSDAVLKRLKLMAKRRMK